MTRSKDIEFCEYPDGCSRAAKFALFRLKPDGTKVWEHYCDEHEKEVVKENRQVREDHPGMKFVEDPIFVRRD